MFHNLPTVGGHHVEDSQYAEARRASDAASSQPSVIIPFEFEDGTIYVQTTIGPSRPFWFILDTGAQSTALDLSIAESLGLDLRGRVRVVSEGKRTVLGNEVVNSACTIKDIPSLSQPISLAFPLDSVSKVRGREVAGILGSDFLSRFVPEIDYSRHILTLHDPRAYHYHGKGEIIPIAVHEGDMPCVRAWIVDQGQPPIEGILGLDLGSNFDLILHRPFLEANPSLKRHKPTIQSLGARSVGSTVPGSIGRISLLQIGSLSFTNPLTFFPKVKKGKLTSSDLDGSIGSGLLDKFTVILDYNHEEMVLELNSQPSKATEYTKSGLFLTTREAPYTTFVVDGILKGSPASEAGLKRGDILLAINGHRLVGYKLSQVRQLIRDATVCNLVIMRGKNERQISLKTRILI